MIDAQDAYRIGLANHVVPQEELLDYCKAMAGRIMKNAPYAVSLAKQVINSGADMDLDNGLKLEANIFGLSFSTEDKKEGMTAFLEKRKEKHFIASEPAPGNPMKTKKREDQYIWQKTRDYCGRGC
jgi:enoyl-CoA hydratase